MRDYISMIPTDFPLSQEVGIIAAEQLGQAIDKGTTHFSTGDYRHLPTVKDVLEEIGTVGVFISYHESMKDTVGLHDFMNNHNSLISMPDKVRKMLGLEDAEPTTEKE